MQTPPDTSAWDDPVLRSARLFNRVQRLFARLVDDRLSELGFRFAYVPVLAALQDGSSRPQKDLARIAEIEQASMAQILARMERDGLILRERDPNDGRSTLVSLTATARKRLPFARQALRQASREAVAGLDETDVQTLGRLLERVIANLDQAMAGIGGTTLHAREQARKSGASQ
jgi:MarR family transcriptional regulator, transcriptional regulator for hemolysin